MTRHDQMNPDGGLPVLYETYTFEQFVESPGNQAALTAAKTIAAHHGNPGPQIHPNMLFLHGGAGLGKTHLMVAIAHAIQQRQPDCRTRYRTMDEFFEELLPALRKHDMGRFIHGYQQLDVLLLDHVELIRTMERTQTEISKILDTLVWNGKTVVMASALPLKMMQGLQEGLASRFAWGGVVEVLPLDLEGRTTLLRNWSERLKGIGHPFLSEEAIHWMAGQEVVDIRELAGVLHRISFMNREGHEPISVEQVRLACD